MSLYLTAGETIRPAVTTMAKSKSAASAPTSDDAPKCPVTKEQFLKSAKPLMISIDGKQQVASVKEFSTGSLGWYAGEKVVVEIDGVPVRCQVGLNITVIGSKPAGK